MSNFICKYCSSIRKNKASLSQHERMCPSNSTRDYVNQWPESQRPWLNLDIFVKDSDFKGSLRKIVLRDNLIKYKCSLCNCDPIWNELVLVLHLDHINGVNNDNRICNLRFLCPNCHSQTKTYAGRNTKNPIRNNKPYYKNGIIYNVRV